MLKKILAITGKPGLFLFLSRGKNMIIVETLDEQKKRMPAYASEQIVALADISIYTNDDKEVPLAKVFENIKQQYDGKTVDLHHKKASSQQVVEFFQKALPEYDPDRVHVNDMRKVILWYNILINNKITDFSIEDESAEEQSEMEEKNENDTKSE